MDDAYTFDVALKMFVVNYGFMRKPKRPTFQNVEQLCGLQPNTVLKLVDTTAVFFTIKPPNMVISKQ